MHVLRLIPITPSDQQELETLFKTLNENARLHKLAVNPLLLTVITALHRYERLPDRRVLVYDRCADLLLETWAKLKGTNVRWRDMKMVKEDQYACVAYLGFVLHKRSKVAHVVKTKNLRK
jgi:predicted NACHT family NTPase